MVISRPSHSHFHLDSMSTSSTCLNRRPLIPCKYFQRGSCKNGSSCNFSHHLISPRDGGHVENWLMDQEKASEHENISYLSSVDGFRRMIEILNRPHLSTSAIDRLVVLLTRQDFRTSLLKQATDKIYNALVGSQFLATLHSHIRDNVVPEPRCMEAYVFLCQELMERTANGWNEVPLDALNTLVDKVDHDLAGELNSTIARLLHHKDNKMRMDAMDDQMKALSLVSNFRNLPIIPSKEQLLSLETPNRLPVNHLQLRHHSLAAYLDTHFRLMRENGIAPVRDFVHELCSKSRDPANQKYVYTNVHLEDVLFGYEAIVYQVSFEVEAGQWDRESYKRLLTGSLSCISYDAFQTFSWAVTWMKREPQLIRSGQGLVGIQLLEDSGQRRLERNRDYMMAITPFSYYRGISHVLENLQRPEMDNLPFQDHLISLERHVKEPMYLKIRQQQDVYDFGSAFPLMKEELSTTRFPILENWPEWTSSLDRSQMCALKHGLTKSVALIHGPPGTGKTFIGLLIVKILLENLKLTAWRPSHLKNRISLREKIRGGPIVIVCYANNTLDQFLEGIYAYEKNVIRVGTSPVLEECSLLTLIKKKQEQWQSRDVSFPDDSVYVENKQAYKQQKRLEEEILDCAEMMKIEVATKASLHGVATAEQIQSLFYEGCHVQTVVQVWLNELDKETRVDTVVDGHTQTNNAGSPQQTVLMGEETCGRGKSYKAPWWSTTRMNMPNDVEVDKQEQWHLEMLMNHTDLWSLDGSARRLLHRHWLHTIQQAAQDKLALLSTRYKEACKSKIAIENEIKLSLLRTSKVVGMTTTVAAENYAILNALQAEIVVVVEAARVPESHILGCLTASTKHLIMIGDHLQLRPKVDVEKLAVEHHLDVSLFERLLKSGIDYVTLEQQRRMRPCISKLISSIYPMLKDHECVLGRENVKGTANFNVFFFNHDAPEEQRGDDEWGKVNVEEAEMVAELYLYLLKQGYRHEDITILSMYNGQVEEIVGQLVKRKKKLTFALPRVSIVDNYEGEESKIVIVSLVRSSDRIREGSRGIVEDNHRVCVGLSRAKDGLFMLGNGQVLCEKGQFWRQIIGELQSSGGYGDAMVLSCEKHPETHTKVSKASDFRQLVPNGGCNRPCEYQLECGHGACAKRCHPHDPHLCLEPACFY